MGTESGTDSIGGIAISSRRNWSARWCSCWRCSTSRPRTSSRRHRQTTARNCGRYRSRLILEGVSEKTKLGSSPEKAAGFGMGMAAMPGRREYPTDLSDAEWELIEPLIPPVKPGGRPHTCGGDLPWRTGCAWRLLPHDLPPW